MRKVGGGQEVFDNSVHHPECFFLLHKQEQRGSNGTHALAVANRRKMPSDCLQHSSQSRNLMPKMKRKNSTFWIWLVNAGQFHCLLTLIQRIEKKLLLLKKNFVELFISQKKIFLSSYDYERKKREKNIIIYYRRID